MAQNAPFDMKSPVKNFMVGPKVGGASHRGPLPKYATVYISVQYGV